MTQIVITDTPDLLAEIEMLRRRQTSMFAVYEETIANLQDQLNRTSDNQTVRG